MEVKSEYQAWKTCHSRNNSWDRRDMSGKQIAELEDQIKELFPAGSLEEEKEYIKQNPRDKEDGIVMQTSTYR